MRDRGRGAARRAGTPGTRSPASTPSVYQRGRARRAQSDVHAIGRHGPFTRPLLASRGCAPSASSTSSPAIPESLAPLAELATNIHWTWDRETQALFERLDPRAGSASGARPAAPDRARITADRWERARRRPGDRRRDRAAARPTARRDRLADGGSRAATTPRSDLVAYFSPEFGITEALPQYSGGLGVLAGDHLKAASRPRRAARRRRPALPPRATSASSSTPTAGSRSASPTSTPHGLALDAATGVAVAVDLAGDAVTVAGLAGRRRPHAAVPARHRRRRERARRRAPSPTGSTAATSSTACARRSCSASAACGPCGRSASTRRCSTPTRATPGSSASSASASWSASGLTFAEAVEAVRAGGVFTTHTPVPAGIDRFPRELMEKYFGAFAAECGVTLRRADGPRPAPTTSPTTTGSTWR